MASISIRCPSCSATEGVVRNGKSTAGLSAISALIAVKHGNYSSLTPPLSPVRTRKSLTWPLMASDVAPVHALWALASTRFYVT
ncbi:IS1 family transposase [Escherichia coli]|uniref:IS1 family transposase n=1 Tax=Escherichia coli TaxID=562 RepID=UPI0038905E9A